MLESPIQRLIPTAEELLRVPVEQLIPMLLRLAKDQCQQAGFVPEVVCQIAVNNGYPGHKKQEVENRLSRVWNQIERKGLIEPAPGMNGRNGWRMFTDDGDAIAKGADLDAIVAAQDFPRALLHQVVIEKCEGLFNSRHYPETVEISFKVVRDRLRVLTM